MLIPLLVFSTDGNEHFWAHQVIFNELVTENLSDKLRIIKTSLHKFCEFGRRRRRIGFGFTVPLCLNYTLWREKLKQREGERESRVRRNLEIILLAFFFLIDTHSKYLESARTKENVLGLGPVLHMYLRS